MESVLEQLRGLLILCVLQVVVSSYEAASSIVIEFDMDYRIFGLPRQFVVASAGKHENSLF